MNCEPKSADGSWDVESVLEGISVAATSGNPDDEIGSLARELARGQSDLIDQFQRYAGMEIAEIFATAGETRFREQETSAILA